jgi:hypothetical protein
MMAVLEYLLFFAPAGVPLLLLVAGVVWGIVAGLAATLILWWVILVVAGSLTLLVGVPVLVRFVHHAREVDRLARETLVAARGIAADTSNIAALDQLLAHAGGIAKSAGAIDSVAGRIHADGAAVVRVLSGRR